MDTNESYKDVQQKFRITALITFITLLTGVLFYHFVEGLSWVDAIYYCVITLTTVGYGDIVPQTDAAKIFTVFYVFVGIGIIATFAQLFLKSAIARRRHHDEEVAKK